MTRNRKVLFVLLMVSSISRWPAKNHFWFKRKGTLATKVIPVNGHTYNSQNVTGVLSAIDSRRSPCKSRIFSLSAAKRSAMRHATRSARLPHTCPSARLTACPSIRLFNRVPIGPRVQQRTHPATRLTRDPQIPACPPGTWACPWLPLATGAPGNCPWQLGMPLATGDTASPRWGNLVATGDTASPRDNRHLARPPGPPGDTALVNSTGIFLIDRRG